MSEALEAWTLGLNIITILYIIAQLTGMILLTLDIWEVLPITFSCDIIVFIMVWVYHLSNSLFYGILVTRLQVAFYLSSMKYSNCTIISLYTFIIIYTIFVCVGTPFLIYGQWLYDGVDGYADWCHIHTLTTTASSISIGIWILMDVIISIALCYLFIRPIKQVLKLTATSPGPTGKGNQHPQGRFTVVYIKYATLTYISIILNMIGLLLYLFKHLTIVIEISAAINCICIVFMHAKYQPAFDFCCGWIVNCCMRKKEKENDKQFEGKDGEPSVVISLKNHTSGEDQKKGGIRLGDKPNDIIPSDSDSDVPHKGISVEQNSQNSDESMDEDGL